LCVVDFSFILIIDTVVLRTRACRAWKETSSLETASISIREEARSYCGSYDGNAIRNGIAQRNVSRGYAVRVWITLTPLELAPRLTAAFVDAPQGAIAFVAVATHETLLTKPHTRVIHLETLGPVLETASSTHVQLQLDAD
jgi:hypothetical protein